MVTDDVPVEGERPVNVIGDDSRPRFVPISVIARYLSATPRQAQAWLDQDGVHGYEFGQGGLRYRLSEIEKWINSRRLEVDDDEDDEDDDDEHEPEDEDVEEREEEEPEDPELEEEEEEDEEDLE